MGETTRSAVLDRPPGISGRIASNGAPSQTPPEERPVRRHVSRSSGKPLGLDRVQGSLRTNRRNDIRPNIPLQFRLASTLLDAVERHGAFLRTGNSGGGPIGI